MCGIAGITLRKPQGLPKLGALADALLLAIEHRGRDATGLLALSADDVQIQKQVGSAWHFVAEREMFPQGTRTLLLHTRFATVGARNDPRNAHPVASGDIAAVHNGTVMNDAELFAEIGVERNATVDSEIIPALVNWGGWDSIADLAGLLLGGAAVAMIDVKRPTEVALARTSAYPLVYMVASDVIVWASTPEAIVRAWRHVYGKAAPLGKFHVLPEWTVQRIVNGKLAKREKITPDKNAPRPAYTTSEFYPGAWRENTRSKSKRYANTTAERVAAMSRDDDARMTLWDDDVRYGARHRQLEETFASEGLVYSEGRWTPDGAYEADGALDELATYWPDVPPSRKKSVLEMDESEWRKWLESEDGDGFVGL